LVHGCGFGGCGLRDGEEPAETGRIYVGIRTAGAEDGRVSLCYAGEGRPRQGDAIVVDSDRGLEFAEVVEERPLVFKACQTRGARRLVRLATDEDREALAHKRAKEREALRLCTEKSRERALDMKLVRAEYDWELRRLLVIYTSEGRVDFRELVKDLARTLGNRIEMRQVGVRDGTRLIGGLGPCGLTLCCSTFLHEFHPVTIKMAKNQNLSLNPSKISGQCGRLMCCLAYENDVYLDRRAKGIPPAGLPPAAAGEEGEDGPAR
jgi:cell fate regulator YaaT (PSP1 superfamily)